MLHSPQKTKMWCLAVVADATTSDEVQATITTETTKKHTVQIWE